MRQGGRRERNKHETKPTEDDHGVVGNILGSLRFDDGNVNDSAKNQ